MALFKSVDLFNEKNMSDYCIKVNRKPTSVGGRLTVFGNNRNNTALVLTDSGSKSGHSFLSLWTNLGMSLSPSSIKTSVNIYKLLKWSTHLLQNQQQKIKVLCRSRCRLVYKLHKLSKSSLKLPYYWIHATVNLIAIVHMYAYSWTGEGKTVCNTTVQNIDPCISIRTCIK